MSKKQTAVEWLMEQLFEINRPDLVEQAKAMEKEQIIQTAKDNCEELTHDEAEEYYNSKFN